MCQLSCRSICVQCGSEKYCPECCNLGLQYVLNKIRNENAAVRTPSVVRRWTNLADRRDPVAVDVHLADDFEPNDRGVCVEDKIVINGYRSLEGKPNHHKIYGYLRTPELTELVRSFL